MALWGGVIHLLDFIYPIGHILETTNADFNPNNWYTWQTWERYGNGRVTVGVNESDTDFASAGLKLGEKKHSHKYGIQVGTHYYDTLLEKNSHAGLLNYSENNTISLTLQTLIGSYNQTANNNSTTSSKTVVANAIRHVAQSEYVDNIQPSVTVYRWRRTA